MTRHSSAAVAIVATAVFACTHGVRQSPGTAVVSVTPAPGERHLGNVHQLTTAGENAEAYFSPDGRLLIFQSTRDGRSCDQEYIMRVDGSHLRRVSTGSGKTTCGWFLGDG